MMDISAMRIKLIFIKLIFFSLSFIVKACSSSGYSKFKHEASREKGMLQFGLKEKLRFNPASL